MCKAGPAMSPSETDLSSQVAVMVVTQAHQAVLQGLEVMLGPLLHLWRLLLARLASPMSVALQAKQNARWLTSPY